MFKNFILTKVLCCTKARVTSTGMSTYVFSIFTRNNTFVYSERFNDKLGNSGSSIPTFSTGPIYGLMCSSLCSPHIIHWKHVCSWYVLPQFPVTYLEKILLEKADNNCLSPYLALTFEVNKGHSKALDG